MRKTIIVAAIVAAVPAVTITGCGSSWWTNFVDDPVQQVQTFEQGVQVALNDAAIAWSVIQPFLPASSAAQITQQYNNAVFAVNHALQVLSDAVTAAVAAETPNPDFSTLMTAVTDAVSQVLAIIQQYVQPAAPVVADSGAPAVPDAGPPLSAKPGKALPSVPAYDEAVLLNDRLKKSIRKPKH
jgi:hypothetical protein